jgi:putative hydrolase of the HAD superfamily
MVNPQSIQAVLFDAVGTLIYAEPPVADVYHAAGRRYGSQLDRVAVERRFRAAMRRRAEQLLSAEPPPTSHAAERAMWREIVCEVFDDLPRETAGGELFETLWRHFARPQSWRLYDDVAGAWRELESRGYRLGVASNFDDRLAGVCRGLPPLDACRHLFWSARIGHSKPSREFFRRVEQALGLAPTELLLVGDDWHSDIEGARRAGWSAVYLDRSGQSKSPGHIASLMELPNLLAP